MQTRQKRRPDTVQNRLNFKQNPSMVKIKKKRAMIAEKDTVQNRVRFYFKTKTEYGYFILYGGLLPKRLCGNRTRLYRKIKPRSDNGNPCTVYKTKLVCVSQAQLIPWTLPGHQPRTVYRQ